MIFSRRNWTLVVLRAFFLKRHKKGNKLGKRIEPILSEPSTCKSESHWLTATTFIPVKLSIYFHEIDLFRDPVFFQFLVVFVFMRVTIHLSRISHEGEEFQSYFGWTQSLHHPLDTDEFSVNRLERSIPSYQMEVNYFEMFAKWAALRLFAWNTWKHFKCEIYFFTDD